MARTNMAASRYYFLLVLVWWLWTFPSRVFCTHGGCIIAEQEVLLQFKHGLDDPQGNLDTWTIGDDNKKDCCNGWSGVGCDNQTGHVVELNLRSMKLGVRDCKHFDQPTLCRLKHLGHLDFSSNNFDNCSIPSFLGCFTELRYLNLSTSYFHGIVPSSLDNLSNLVQLDLSNFRPLDVLFEDPLIIDDASWLRRLLSLEYIDMSFLQLKNSSSNWIQSLNELPSLSKLICSNCKMETFPRSLRLRFSSLQTLDLSYCGLKGHIPAFIESMQSLQELNLSWNNFGGSVPTFLGNLPSLTSLDLSSNYFNGFIPRSIGNLSSLQKLDFSINNFNGFIPNSIGNLSSLQSLVLTTNKLKGTVPSSLGNLSSLQSLDLSSNKLEGSIPPSIGKLSLLQKLDLSLNNFNGSIPSSIGNLSLLQELDLSLNHHLNGFIPSSIGNLSLLQKLDLSYNNFSRSIPTFLGNLSSLQYLDLSSNKLNGLIPSCIGNLSSLRYLHFSNNNLIGSIPTFLGNLTSLKALCLDSNNFNGSIPKSLCNMFLLKSLYLDENDNIDGADAPKCLWGLSKLQYLYLGGHDFIISESHLSNMSQLKGLSLQSNLSSILHISSSNWLPPFSLSYLYIKSWRMKPNEFPTWIHTQDKLSVLVLSNVGITGSLPAWIWNFSSSLIWLNVTSNNMDGEISDATNFSNAILGVVDLSSNKFEGSTWLSAISKMTSTLSYLTLSNNNLFGGIPLLLCEAQHLVVLDLSKNNFSGKIPDCLMNVGDVLQLGSNRFNGTFPRIQEHQCTLESLHLESNELYGSLPSSLSKCNSLGVLDLGENKFTGSIPSWPAESMQSLKILLLRSNGLLGNIPHSISRFKSLQVLDLGNNNLSGSIPMVEGDFKAMKVVQGPKKIVIPRGPYHFQEKVILSMKARSDGYFGKILSLVKSIDLSNNKLSGVIPHEFGDLYGLVNFNLSGNQFTGNIPKTLSGLLHLQTLDLSRNNLFGQIPHEMVKLTFLSNLNLSFNNLSGSIPRGKQFSTFNNGSYIGNLNLCGPPLSKNCQEEQNSESKSENKDDDNDEEKLWLYMTAVFGFIIGFWTFFGILFFKKTWRYSYLQFLNDASEVLYIRIIQPIRRMVK